jgi:hypothetical protein
MNLKVFLCGLLIAAVLALPSVLQVLHLHCDQFNRGGSGGQRDSIVTY